MNRSVSGPGAADGSEYGDGLIACSPDELVIRKYGPLLAHKKIPYAEIREVRQFELNAVRR